MKTPIAALLSLAAALAALVQPPAADRIIVNGKIWTGDPSQPEADAMAIAGDRVLAVGSNAAIRAMARAATVVTDVEGRRIVPGFNDAHWHLPTRRTADLAEAGSVEEIQARLKEFALSLPPDAWITGRGWKPTDFPGNIAHRKYLDAIFPNRPVYITDRDGHQSLANSRALALAAVTKGTADPANGRVERDASGEPTGLLKEGAASLVGRLLPRERLEDVHAALVSELDKAAALGLTSLQIASGQRDGSFLIEAARRLRDAGALKVRLRIAVPFDRNVTKAELDRAVALRDASDSWLAFGIAKGMLDGTVDAHTAAMLEPYSNAPGTGIPMWEQALLNKVTADYDRAGIQIELHAIGDRAIRMALDAFEHAGKANGARDRRHRIEHVEVPALSDLPRFKALGVIASTQAIFALPDETTLKNYAPALGPERASRAVAFKLFDDAGAVQAFGSDYPVFPMDPLRGMHAAVMREDLKGNPKGGWYPENRISVTAALRHYTHGSAFASFDEGRKGTLEAGQFADFVVLSEDVVADSRSLATARVVLTFAGGKQTYQETR